MAQGLELAQPENRCRRAGRKGPWGSFAFARESQRADAGPRSTCPTRAPLRPRVQGRLRPCLSLAPVDRDGEHPRPGGRRRPTHRRAGDLCLRARCQPPQSRARRSRSESAGAFLPSLRRDLEVGNWAALVFSYLTVTQRMNGRVDTLPLTHRRRGTVRPSTGSPRRSALARARRPSPCCYPSCSRSCASASGSG